MYDFGEPVYGTPHSVGYGSVSIPNGSIRIATAHTHPNSNSFSSTDKTNALKRGLNSYVIGPNLELQKYDVENQNTSIVALINPTALTGLEKSELTLQFQASWDNQLQQDCSFLCDTMIWPTP